jgi:hypothetical protein
MLSHTLPLEGRDGQRVRLSGEEAIELYRRGFRFSVFRPGVEECRLSQPLETVVNFEAATLTLRQAETAK